MKRNSRENTEGKRLIFRWTRKCPYTGKIIRAKGRPFPMWVDK